LAATSEPDPIFAVIAEHQTAIEAHVRAVEEYDEDTPSEVYQRSDDALWELLTVQPTTLAGIAALLHHVGQDQWLDLDDSDVEGNETVLSAAHSDFPQAAQEFPVCLAEIMRAILARGRGGGVA
jgi:hypothetical protein